MRVIARHRGAAAEETKGEGGYRVIRAAWTDRRRRPRLPTVAENYTGARVFGRRHLSAANETGDRCSERTLIRSASPDELLKLLGDPGKEWKVAR